MNSILKDVIRDYDLKQDNEINIAKEIMQKICLSALSRTDFFTKIAFRGDTCLRLFYGLDRFSEDLDFTFIKSNNNFDFPSYFNIINNEFTSLGIEVNIVQKKKTNQSEVLDAYVSTPASAFFKALFGESKIKSFNKSELLKVKIEVDTKLLNSQVITHKSILTPYPCNITLFDLPTIFAGKIHACLLRNWKHRVKGRDFYDYVYLLSHHLKPNMEFLKEKLINSGVIKAKDEFTIEQLKSMLYEKFKQVDFQLAKDDVIEFINDKRKIEIWSSEFFCDVSEQYLK